MRFLAVAPTAVLLLVASSLHAQEAQRQSWCATVGSPVTVDSLRELVREYYPEALDPARRRDSVLVGFILNGSCRVMIHATGRYHADRLGVEGLLTSLIPDAQVQPFVQAGIAEATPKWESVPGAPWIVWVTRRL